MRKQMDPKEDDGEATAYCAECRREIVLGEDMLTVQFTVLGARGPVPLDKALFFCDEKCLERYFSDEPVMKMPRRIP